jgi:CRP-like cAMP-binding protein
MWLVGVRDLQFRRRRFMIAALATSVVFSMTLLMAGVSNGLDAEIEPPNGYFGELAPMFGLRRSAGARALEPTVVTGYNLGDFRDRRTGSSRSS